MSFWCQKPTEGEKRTVAIAVMVGALARLAWSLTAERIKPVINESHNVAVSLARTGQFADTFFAGQGPTAHVGMLTPLPSAFAYWLFGPDSFRAELLLVLWSAGLISLAIWLCWKLSVALRVPRAARLAAVLLVSLVPLQFGLEMREGRSWEVALAAALLIGSLLRLVEADGQETITTRNHAVTGALVGLLFVVNPAAGLAAMTAGAFALRHWQAARWWIAPVACAAVIGVLTGFWAERNLAALHEPILLRDNLGLELDLSNYPGAVHPQDPHAAYMARLKQMHPLFGDAVYRLSAVGEVRYYGERGVEALRWIKQNPREFLFLDGRILTILSTAALVLVHFW